MKILFVSSDNNKTSGAFLCLVELIVYLKKIYDMDSVVIIPKPGDGIELLKAHNIRYKYVQSFSWITYSGYSLRAIIKTIFKISIIPVNILAVYKICKIIREENIDIVHTNTIFSYVGALAAKLEKAKHIWHIRECINESYHSKILFDGMGYGLIDKSDRILAVSGMVKEHYQYLLKKSIDVVYDGVSDKFVKSREIFKSQCIEITCIGSLSKNKNQIDLLRAAVNLKQCGYNNFHINIVGRGSAEKELKDYVHNNELNNFVKFWGNIDNVNNVLDITDVVCTMAHSEAFGRTVVEGMLHNCLVVGAVSKDNALNEIIDNGVTGYTFPFGNINELSQLLQNCMNENKQSKLRIIATKGKQKAEKNFLVYHSVGKIYKFYERLILKVN